jgi:hypothetical protein
MIIVALSLSNPAWAQAEPGATVQTHHETVPNPVFGSSFRVSPSCQGISAPCAWDSPGTWTAGSVPSLSTRVIIDGNVRIRTLDAVALEVGVYPTGVLSFDPAVNTRLRTGDIVVFAGGKLEIGTPSAPIQSAVTAEVVLRDIPFDNDPKQHLRGILSLDGTVRLDGGLADRRCGDASDVLAVSCGLDLELFCRAGIRRPYYRGHFGGRPYADARFSLALRPSRSQEQERHN